MESAFQFGRILLSPCGKCGAEHVVIVPCWHQQLLTRVLRSGRVATITQLMYHGGLGETSFRSPGALGTSDRSGKRAFWLNRRPRNSNLRKSTRLSEFGRNCGANGAEAGRQCRPASHFRGDPTYPLEVAGSGGRCNTCAKFTRRSLKAQSFSRTLIQTKRDLVQLGLCVAG